MRVILHAGTHKTGTTAFQELLFANSDFLAAQGILYPRTPQHRHSFELNVKRDGWTPAGAQSMLRAAEAAKADTLLLSAEAISTFTDAQFTRLADAFHGNPIVMLVVVRDPVSFLPSRWSQNCVQRDTQQFGSYLHYVRDASRDHCDVRPDKFVQTVLNNRNCELRALSYDSAGHEGAGIVLEVLKAAGLPQTVLEFLRPKVARLNASSNWIRREMSRLLNGVLADRLHAPQDDWCRALGEARLVDSGPLQSAPFRLGSLFSSFDPTLMGEAETLINSRAVSLSFDIADLKQESAARLAQFQDCFQNLAGGEIFSAGSVIQIRSTDLVWQDFKALGDAILGDRWRSAPPA